MRVLVVLTNTSCGRFAVADAVIAGQWTVEVESCGNSLPCPKENEAAKRLHGAPTLKVLQLTMNDEWSTPHKHNTDFAPYY